MQHDWLKNHYILKIAYYLSIIDGHVEDAEFEKAFWANILPEWPSQRAELLSLADQYQEDMGPAILLKETPLNEIPAETKLWLTPVLIALWRVRNPVDYWTEESRIAASRVNRAYEELQPFRSANRGFASRQFVVNLLDSCRELSRVVALFPTTVRLL